MASALVEVGAGLREAAEGVDALLAQDAVELARVEPDPGAAVALVDLDVTHVNAVKLPLAFDALHEPGASIAG